ncbi:MAG TPA: alpha/beta hydrolase, partial [Candidatus Acidoferrum sp.]|nr:alpha/beta hydrolase [Candidatus Acidoferrum sp.]
AMGGGRLAGQRPAATEPGKTRAAAHPATSLEGEWAGVLAVGETELQLVLHLSRDAAGTWHGKLDSLNQAVYGMEASKITREEDTLKIEIASVGAKFEGKIQPDRRTIRGVWEQGGAGLPLKLEKRAASVSRAAAANAVSQLEGTWQGAIEVTNMRMRLQMHVSHDEQGKLLASVDSLDQGIYGIPAAEVAETNGQLTFEIPAFQAEYRGTLSASKNELAGEWAQNDTEEQLDFRRSDQPLDLRRPQNPVKPYPYAAEEVSFPSGGGKETLKGTLTIPPGAGPFAAALLVGGSGPSDRDGTIAGHKPFLVLADLLTRKGIAVLRYDKRGAGEAAGGATLADFASDALAALAYLKARKEVDRKRVGIVGNSEGGILAAEVALRSEDLDWLVLLATPATTGETTLLRQSELVARTGGLPEEQIARSQQFDRLAYAAVREEKSAARLRERLNSLVEKSGLSASMPPAALDAQIRLMTAPWFREYLDLNPAPVFEKIRCPVLALNGDRDLQVDADETVPLLRQAYEKSGNKDFTVLEIQGVNHLFQRAQSGSPALYGAIEETMAPEVQNAISGWVARHSAQ